MFKNKPTSNHSQPGLHYIPLNCFRSRLPTHQSAPCQCPSSRYISRHIQELKQANLADSKKEGYPPLISCITSMCISRSLTLFSHFNSIQQILHGVHMFGLKCLLNYSGIRGTSNRHLIRHGNYRSYMVFDRVLPTVSIGSCLC